MFKNLFKRSGQTPASTDSTDDVTDAPEAEVKQASWMTRLTRGLSKTRQQLSASLKNIFTSNRGIDDALFAELEQQLLLSDIGLETTSELLENLKRQAREQSISDPEALFPLFKRQLADYLAENTAPLNFDKQDGPFVILMIGVNGNGKTTTIGKLAQLYTSQNKSVMLAAGDTFRAAAVEQLKAWGDRANVPVVAQETGSDSASVIFDAFQSAKAKNIDILIADTAGRLHTRDDLMQELFKIKKVLAKIDPNAPHEIMLVLDAGTGQNALAQAKTFDEAIGVTGITLTKLDGTAKGGMIFSIAKQCRAPIRYIGVGEGMSDLKAFEAHDFVDALFDTEHED